MIFKHSTMKTTFLFFLLLANISCDCLAQNPNHRFMIFVNRKAGYIDETGKVVIPPKFLAAGEFSTGLAAVRVNGGYGYIDEQGTFVIPAQYDYALGFSGGLAQVYVNKKSFFIDSSGKKVFEAEYSKISAFKNGRAMVTTLNNKHGFIDCRGKLVIDTMYAQIRAFSEGLAVVSTGYNLYGIIDTLGQTVVPNNKFRLISDFSGDYARAFAFLTPEEKAQKLTSIVIIDRTGNVVLTRQYEKNVKIMEEPHDGIVRIHLYDKDSRSFHYDDPLVGYMNLKGDIIFSNNQYNAGKNFSNNRAFIRSKGGLYSLIDTKGKIVKELFCESVLEPGFRKGLAFVKVKDKWGLIDTNANFLIPPTYQGIDENSRTDDYFFFKESSPSQKSENILYGVSGIDGKIWIKPVLSNFDRSGFHGGILKGVVDHKLTYFDREGKVIWQQAENESRGLLPLNIDCQRAGSFTAHSEHTSPNEGGYAGSGNDQRDIKDASRFPEGLLSLQVRTDVKDTFHRAYQGYEVYLANRTALAQKFSAEDSRLSMVIQALDKKGEWNNIEYLTNSWCGNSYHTLILDANKCWKFTAPVYEGDFKTKLRIALTLKYDPYEPVILYSNTYNGSINPSQFWKEEEPQYLRDILNPYTLLPKSYHTLY